MSSPEGGKGRVEGVLYEEYSRTKVELAPKVPGKHRWFMTACYNMPDDWMENANNPDVLKFLDHENRFMIALGCWDCEGQFGEIEVGSVCPGEPPDA